MYANPKTVPEVKGKKVWKLLISIHRFKVLHFRLMNKNILSGITGTEGGNAESIM